METGIFKNKYKTESARKTGHDYTSNGWYFVTVCTKNTEPFFGNITDGKMRLSKIGKIAEKYWREIPKHFPFTKLNEFTIMPNHIHGIVGINRNCRDADLSRLTQIQPVETAIYRVSAIASCQLYPNHRAWRRRDKSASVRMRDKSRRDKLPSLRMAAGGVTGENNPMGKNTLGEIIRWYKGRCTFEIGKMKRDKSRFYNNFAWQPRFYDRVIRNDEELNRIRKYIFDNVSKWEFDRNNPENI